MEAVSQLEERCGNELWSLFAGAVRRDFDAWGVDRQVPRAAVRAWYAHAQQQVRRLEAVAGPRLRALGCGDLQ
eukprot:5112347-Alexandrium_andersonii.AAC.1